MLAIDLHALTEGKHRHRKGKKTDSYQLNRIKRAIVSPLALHEQTKVEERKVRKG